MVVDKYVGRCLDVGSTPTGSIIPLHSFAKIGETLLNQRFLFLSLVFLSILLRKRESQKGVTKGVTKRRRTSLKINTIRKACSYIFLFIVFLTK